MINLLPPELKCQIEYSKRNGHLRGLIALIITCIIVAGLSLGATSWLLEAEASRTQTEASRKQEEIKALANLETEARALSDRLKSAKLVLNSQSRFSALLSELANVTPAGAYINSIALTGDLTQPVKISATAKSYTQAVSLRDSLAASAKVASADIDDVSNPAAGNYRINLTVVFNPGADK